MSDKKIFPLKIQADLSEASYEEAIHQIKGAVGDGVFYQSFSLCVSLWDADTALNIMGKYRNCYVLVTPEFGQYKWSLGSDLHGIVITSEGA